MQKISNFKKSIIALVVAISLYSGNYSVAGASGREKTALPHLKLGVGAKANALGNAYTAICEDATGVYWNPASLAIFTPVPKKEEGTSYRSREIAMMVTKLSLERIHGFASIVQRLPKINSGFGLAWYYFSTTNIEERSETGSLNGYIANYNHTGSVSYGIKLDPQFLVGVTVKYHNIALHDVTGYGFSGDFGLLYFPQATLLKFGLLIKDISTGISWSTDHHDNIMSSFRLGFGWDILYQQLILSSDFEQTMEQPYKLHVGLEYRFENILSLMLGLDDLNLTSGLGVRVDVYQIQYSFTLDKEELSNAHRFSIIAYF